MDDTELRALLAAQQQQIAELVSAMRPAQPTATVGEIYQRYEKAWRDRPAWYSRRAMLHPFVKQFADRRAVTLDQRDWAEHRSSRSDLAASSRNVVLRYVKAMLRDAVRDGYLREDPALCKAVEEDQREHRETAPTEAEIQLLLAACELPRERVIVLCACDCGGMRRNEIRQLQWSWIDRQRMEIAVPNGAAKNRRGGVLPMTARALDAIEAMPRVLRSPYVLANPESKTGAPYVAQMLTNWARALMARAGLEPAPGDTRVHLHDLRASFATNASERGVRLESISEIMRHASLDQTRVYTRRRPRDLERARAVFEAGIERDTARR